MKTKTEWTAKEIAGETAHGQVEIINEIAKELEKGCEDFGCFISQCRTVGKKLGREGGFAFRMIKAVALEAILEAELRGHKEGK